MADIDTSTWSETAASNNAAPPDGWPENQSYASVNNCARETMGGIEAGVEPVACDAMIINVRHQNHWTPVAWLARS
jgi:hypothetical protein